MSMCKYEGVYDLMYPCYCWSLFEQDLNAQGFVREGEKESV